MYDHQKDGTAFEVANGYTVGHNRNRRQKKNTYGWQLCVKMKWDFTEWLSLKDLKESNLVELAEYSVSNKIDHKPSIAWWVPYTLQKQNRIISNQKK